MSGYAGYDRPYTGRRTALTTLTRRPPPTAYAAQRIPESPGYNQRDPWYPDPLPAQPHIHPAGPDGLPGQGGPGGQTTGGQVPGSTGGSTGASGSTDPYANDPIYQQIVAIANQEQHDAEASALAQRRQEAVDLGDPALAQQLGLGQNFADAAQANPFSVLKGLLRAHNQNVSGIDQGTNHSNLFYSSTRARDQQQEQTGYQGNTAQAYKIAQSTLAQIAAQLLAAQRDAATQRANAARDAYGRAAGQPTVPGADGSGSGPNGEWTQPDAFRVLLGSAFKRAQFPRDRGPTGGL